MNSATAKEISTEGVGDAFWPVQAAELIGDTARPCPACLHTQNRMVRLPGEPGDKQEHFDYVLCGACGTLAIAEMPADLGRYYGAAYYSFAGRPLTGFRGWLKAQRDDHELRANNLLGAALSGALGAQPRLRSLRPLFDGSLDVATRLNSSILDVGCGSGTLLRELKNIGFTKLTGIDAFVPAPTSEPGLEISKSDLASLSGQFDIVMFHHSFEHMPEPDNVLRDLAQRMSDKSVAVIRIPLGASFGWRTYGGHWAQLDPPRHLFLFSVRGFSTLASRAGFAIRRMSFDSTGDFFVWSEMRKRGLSEQKQDGKHLFSRRQLARFDHEARVLNAEGRGEQATFFLTRT